ncbi:MAG: hypothetical protein J0L57_22230, partial [Burkholderiales bacterium]|nr:hypothetical protein [Burkholderiales bacterium]
FFHDGRARSLEEQALMLLLHPDEMANPDLAALVARTAKLPGLRALFVRAYADARPTPARIATALAAYQRTLLAGDSPFDRWHYGGDASAMPAAARRGFEVFRAQGCDRCHPVGPGGSLFTDHGFHNVGVAWRSRERQRQDQAVQLVPGLMTRLTPEEIARIGVPDRPDLGRAARGRPARDPHADAAQRRADRALHARRLVRHARAGDRPLRRRRLAGRPGAGSADPAAGPHGGGSGGAGGVPAGADGVAAARARRRRAVNDAAVNRRAPRAP